MYINRARCSLDEVVACLDLARDDKYITKEHHDLALEKTESLAKQLKGFTIHLTKFSHQQSAVNSQ